MGRRKNLNLLASAYPLDPLPGLDLPDPSEGFPEKYLVGWIEVDGCPVEVHSAHTPPGSTVKMLKVEYWEAMLARLKRSTVATILCGDFNSPWSEDDAGFVVGGDREDPDEEQRWQKAELGFLEHPELCDVYRTHHPAGEPFTHSYVRGTVSRCRYDHVYVSRKFDLGACRCVYLTDWLDDGLSDHAPVLAELGLPKPKGPSVAAASEARDTAPL